MTKKIDISANFEETAEAALWGAMDQGQIAELSTSIRCKLINVITSALIKNKGAEFRKSAQASLLNLVTSFEASDALINWQNKRKNALTQAFKLPENRSILRAFKDWKKISLNYQKDALKKSAKLQVQVYLEGTCRTKPVSYIFKEGHIYNRHGRSFFTYGGFLASSKDKYIGTIKHRTFHGKLERRPEDAFETAHHEATHSVHEALGEAFNSNELLNNHSLHGDAHFFHVTKEEKAIIPSYIEEPYENQVHEILANQESLNIVKVLQELAY